MPKMNVSLTLTKDYIKNDCLAAQKTNPIQTQSKPVLSAVEWANFFKGQNPLPKNPATPAIPQTKRIPCPVVQNCISYAQKSSGTDYEEGRLPAVGN